MALTANQLANAYFSVTSEIPNAALLASLQAIDSTQGDAAAISAIVNDPVSISFAFPIIRVFQLVTGNVPGATQLHGWEGFLETGGSLTQIAVAFASGTYFMNNYNAGNPVNPNGPANLTEMINIISNALNLPTSSATVQGNAAAWVNASNQPNGPTLAQIIVAFATGDQFSAETLANVQAYLTQIATANELTSNPVPGAPPTNGFPPPAQGPGGVSLFSFLPAGGTQTLTLTVGQDTAITGQLFNGTGPMVLGGGVVVNAPIGGLFGNQNTLTPFDNVTLTGSGNTLNAFLVGGGVIGGLSLQGLQTWNLSHTGGGTELAGSANLGGGAPGAGNLGVQTITYQNSTGLMVLGTPGGVGLQSLVQTINMTNSPGAALEAFISSALFGATSALTVNVANSTGSIVVATSDGAGTAGYATWNIAVQDAVGDTVTIAGGGTAATTVNLTDPGGGTLTLLSAGGMTKVATVNGSAMTAALTVTGAETGAGFLTGNTALKTITGGAGNDTFDLSGFGTTAIQGMTSINGGGGTNRVDIAIGVATDTVTPLKPLTNLSNEQIIALAGNTGGAATVNVANFNQGTATDTALTTFDLVNAAGGGLGITLGGNLSFTKMTSGLTVNIDNTNLGGFNLAFTDASTSSTTDKFTLEEGNNTGDGGTITTNGFGTVTLQTDAANALAVGGFTANANPGGGITLDFTSGAGSTGGIFLGNILAEVVGTPQIVTHNGVINDNAAGPVFIGISDAAVINASGSTATGAGGGLFMTGPTDFNGATQVTGAPGAANFLEGSVTALVADGAGPGFIGTFFNDAITGGTFGGDFIWGDGGQDAITLGVGHTHGDTVVFGEVELNFNIPGSAANPILEFTNNGGIYQNPTTASTTNSFASTIANFNPAIDAVDFRAAGWGSSAGYLGLQNGTSAHKVVAGDATQFQVITSAGATILGPTNVVGDAVTTYADDAHFLAAIQGAGGFVLTAAPAVIEDMLFAFSDGTNLHIAEVRIGGGATTTAGALAAHDLAVLNNVATVGSLTNADIHFV